MGQQNAGQQGRGAQSMNDPQGRLLCSKFFDGVGATSYSDWSFLTRLSAVRALDALRAGGDSLISTFHPRKAVTTTFLTNLEALRVNCG